jgi:hypothetical protein
MDQYSVRYTRGHLKELLSKLPFEITRYGAVVAKVVGKSALNDVHTTSGVKTLNINPFVEKGKVLVINSDKFIKKQSNFCEHGAMKGLCRHGCR